MAAMEEAMHRAAAEPRIWLIAGPTGSGKSALALRLAEASGGEIVNADSMQVYGDLRLVTARPTLQDESLAPHHLYGLADGADAWSVGRWLAAARTALADIERRQRTAIVVGGTGLYFRALTEGLATIPTVPRETRERARADFDRVGERAFRDILFDLDPEAAARIAPGDRQRLMRAFEVAVATGRPISSFQGEAAGRLAPGSWRGVVLDPPRAALYARCDARLAAMIEAGALEEVRALLARGLAADRPVVKALGVREFAEHLAGRSTLAEALVRARQSTRRYVKRQTTWFRHQAPDWPRLNADEPEDQWRHLLTLASP